MKKRVIAICLALFLVASPLFAESQKHMLYRLQDELNDLKQQFEWLVEEMTIKFTQLRDMNRQGIEELNRHLQSISKQLNDQDGRIRTLEPRVEALESVVSEVAVSSIGDPLPKGTPAPKIGDAVHYSESDGFIYRGVSVVRNNIIGVMGSGGRVVRSGYAYGLPGLLKNKTYYLEHLFVSEVTVSETTATDKSLSIRYNSSTYSQAQSFLGVAEHVPMVCELVLAKVGSPSFPLPSIIIE